MKKLTKKQKKFERCVLQVKKKKQKVNPYAVCRVSTGFKGSTRFDPPPPNDYWIEGDILIRLMPDIDNLFEIAIYIPSDQFEKIKKEMDRLGIKYELIENGYIARRGRNEKATNVFIIQS